MTGVVRNWKQTRGQDLAEYGIALGTIGSLATVVALFIRVDVFLLWLRAMIKIFRAAGVG